MAGPKRIKVQSKAASGITSMVKSIFGGAASKAGGKTADALMGGALIRKGTGAKRVKPK